MRTSDFDYELPPERIAQEPAEPRDSTRLLVLDRSTGAISHRCFRELSLLLSAGDLVVANDTRVIPARLRGRKSATGGGVEVLLLRPRDEVTWEVLVRGHVRPGSGLCFDLPDGVTLQAVVRELLPDGGRVVAFDQPVEPHLADAGAIPLPPYIRRPLPDDERYQTVYSRVAGSAASPTAGLHFTPRLIAALEQRGIRFAFVTLHIGLDTFRPVETELIDDHPIHSEWCELPPDTVTAINTARRAGGRVVAVGTTTVRVLETGAQQATRKLETDAQLVERVPAIGAQPAGTSQALARFAGWTDLYIKPGFHFQVVDALITNFHFPRSTLLMLVSAFAGKDQIDTAYAAALAGDYRFYSFGDAMLIS